MTFPFDSLSLDQRQLGLVVAVAIGFGFGFVLERAGFGRATKLAAQFYLRDMTVFKVMFTAIVTAMLGLVVVASLGLADLGEVSRQIASWTWIWPMLAGGLLLGVGFIVSGYCPGTSVVAAGSGNVDGMAAVAGVMTGTFVYSELLRAPAFAAFHESGELGAVFLYDLVGIPAPFLAAGVALAAIGAFVGAEWVEKWTAARASREWTAPPKRFAFAAVVTLAVVALAATALPNDAAADNVGTVRTIDAAALARRIVDEPWRVRVVDTRPAEAFAVSRVPGSENVVPEAVGDLALDVIPYDRDIVVVGDAPEVADRFLAYRGSVATLAGGFEAWRAYALVPPEAPAGGDPLAIAEWRFRSALNQRLTGTPQAAPPPPSVAAPAVARPAKKGGGCSA